MSVAQDLAGTDYAELTSAERAETLHVLLHADAVLGVARSRVMNAFDANDDFGLDGQRSMSAWLVNLGPMAKGEAAAQRSWAKTVAGFPRLTAAMLAGHLPPSWAKKLCPLLSKIPGEHRPGAEQIVAGAAAAGAVLRDLVYLAAEILARTAPLPEDGKEPGGGHLRLETTMDGAGVLHGELTPECAAAVQAVLGELSQRSGKDDDRSQGERLHDALGDAMRRLLGTGLVPAKQGHPVTAIVHINLADLLALDDGSVFLTAWASEYAAGYAARWAGQQAATSVQPGDGGAWITGPAVSGIVCDAALFPIVGAPRGALLVSPA
jgi:hypothetical protein